VASDAGLDGAAQATTPVGSLSLVVAGDRKIAIANIGGELHGFDDTCTHRGCSLAQGSLEGTVVTCPCHGSQFDVVTGAVVRGPATEPVKVVAIDATGKPQT
jgi:nitrite reductase/ring-hydroxylating ferredoxin subunit